MTDAVLTAKDLMATAVRTVNVSEDIEDVDFTMKSANIHHLPVLDGDQKLVGIVTHGALLEALGSPEARRKPIETIMNREVLTVLPTTAVEKIIELMIENRISCVPVVEESGFLAGILTETDFLYLALAHVRKKAPPNSHDTGYHR